MRNLLKRLWQEEQGQDLIEYALLIVLVSLVAVATMTTLGTTISAVYTNAVTSINNATT